MYTCVPVSANPASSIKATLPPSIKSTWVSDLTALALRDIRQGFFGARRHVLEEYTLVYRLDVSPSMLQAITMTGKGIFTYPMDFPRLGDVVESAKVWLSFDEDKLVQESVPLPAKKSVRAPRSTIPVSFSQHTSQEDKLPSDLRMQWRHILTTLFLGDLEKGLFGARHHPISHDRSITYRVDVHKSVLKQVAESPRWTFENDGKPTINELLSCVKVWISFPEHQVAGIRTVEREQRALESASQATDADDVPMPVPTTPIPLSPTLSDVTLIDDNSVSAPVSPKMSPKAVASPPPNPRAKVFATPLGEPGMDSTKGGFLYGNRAAELASFRRSIGLPPLVPRRRRIDLLTMLKNAATGKSGHFVFGVHRDIEEWGNAF